MADSSLDDFFAKKDKSKKSRKFTTSEQIARKLEEGGGKKPNDNATTTSVKKEKEKVVIVPTSTSTTTSTVSPVFEQQADDEWRDFEEEKEKDYTGLKIQNLQLSEAKDDEYDRERNPDDEDGEYLRSREMMSGPWNKSGSNADEGVIERPETPPVVPIIEDNEKKEEAKSSGVYRPPHARSGSASTGSSAAAKAKLSKLAPEISSELHFPSLSAAADTPKGSKKGEKVLESERGFEAVRRGYRSTEEVPCRGPKLDLGNKYNTLSSGDMS